MSSDEDCELLRKAFDIGNCPANIDFSVPPASGIEYLQRVHLEAEKYPFKFMDINEYRSLQKTDSVNRNIVTIPGHKSAPPGFGPTHEWQQNQAESFSNLRIKLSAQKNQFKQKFGKAENLPKKEDAKGWCTFCLGNTACAQFYGEIAEGQDTKRRKNHIKGHPPLLSTILWLNQPTIEKLLSYHIMWMKTLGFSREMGLWIFSLLTCLEKPLTPDACAMLRNLVRVCAEIRYNIKDSEDEFLQPLNLIICLVSNYFDQRDMIDECEDVSIKEADNVSDIESD